MTATDERLSPASQRPPRTRRPWATVTRLGLAGSGGGPVPVSSLALVEGSLALQDPDATRLPGLPQTPELHLVEGSTRATEDVQQWAGRFAQAVVEVLGGDRPLAQLVRWTSQRVYADLDRRLKVLGRSSDVGRRRRTVRPQVRSVHVFHPTPESAEISVHVRHGQRSRAIAARLELTRGRWQCTVLELG